MKTDTIAEILGASVYSTCDAQSIETFYTGDFLSRVMGKAPSGCAWITVMNNINVAGVAVLADVAMIILCEGVIPVDELIERCKTEKIGLLATELPAYEVCKRLG